VTITEDELWEKYDGKAPEGKIVIKPRNSGLINSCDSILLNFGCIEWRGETIECEYRDSGTDIRADIAGHGGADNESRKP